MPKFIIKSKHSRKGAPLYFRSPGQGYTLAREDAYIFDSRDKSHMALVKRRYTGKLKSSWQRERDWVVVPV